MSGFKFPRLASLRNRQYRATSLTFDEALEVIQSKAFEVQPDQFALGRKLGEGSMAEVFEATFQGRKCAAKKLKSGVTQNSGQYQDLLMELHSLAHIGSHPNIVSFYGACIKDQSCPGTSAPLIFFRHIKHSLNLRIASTLRHRCSFHPITLRPGSSLPPPPPADSDSGGADGARRPGRLPRAQAARLRPGPGAGARLDPGPPARAGAPARPGPHPDPPRRQAREPAPHPRPPLAQARRLRPRQGGAPRPVRPRPVRRRRSLRRPRRRDSGETGSDGLGCPTDPVSPLKAGRRLQRQRPCAGSVAESRSTAGHSAAQRPWPYDGPTACQPAVNGPYGRPSPRSYCRARGPQAARAARSRRPPREPVAAPRGHGAEAESVPLSESVAAPLSRLRRRARPAPRRPAT